MARPSTTRDLLIATLGDGQVHTMVELKALLQMTGGGVASAVSRIRGPDFRVHTERNPTTYQLIRTPASQGTPCGRPLSLSATCSLCGETGKHNPLCLGVRHAATR